MCQSTVWTDVFSVIWPGSPAGNPASEKLANGQVLTAPGSTALWQGLGTPACGLANSATTLLAAADPSENSRAALAQEATTTTMTINAAAKRRREQAVEVEGYSIAPWGLASLAGKSLGIMPYCN